MIKFVGKKEVPGRPFLYGTTKEFLDFFGLHSLKDLPKFEEAAAHSQESKGTEVKVSEAEAGGNEHAQQSASESCKEAASEA